MPCPEHVGLFAIVPGTKLPSRFGTKEIDFTVVRGSLICGHTPRSAGLMNLSNVRVLRVSRPGGCMALAAGKLGRRLLAK